MKGYMGFLIVIGLLLLLAFPASVSRQNDHILIHGTPPAGSLNGLAIDHDAHLMNANVSRDTITVMNPVTGAIHLVIEATDDLPAQDDVVVW
jgi:hypothetical protein